MKCSLAEAKKVTTEITPMVSGTFAGCKKGSGRMGINVFNNLRDHLLVRCFVLDIIGHYYLCIEPEKPSAEQDQSPSKGA